MPLYLRTKLQKLKLNMKFRTISAAIACLFLGVITANAAVSEPDTTTNYIDEAVVTGTRAKTLSGFLPQTISVVSHEEITSPNRLNVLPTLNELVPGLFVTSRAMLGYGVSTGAAGGISVRGLSGGGGQMMVLIDGHPQYQGIFGHPIADSYQTLMTERVEVLRGPASVLYGSNAMGGVVNIITRKSLEEGVHTDLNLSAGSYGTFQGVLSNRVRKGRFSSVVSGQYARSNNHRPRMGFEQYGGYGKVGYEFSDNWSAYADVDITHFNASYPGATSAPLFDADQWITRGVASAAIENHYDRTDGAISFYYNFGKHKINDGHAEGAAPQANWFRSEDALAGVSAWQSFGLFKGNTTTVGIDWQSIHGKAWNQVIATGQDLEPMTDKTESEIAGYIDFRQDVASWLTVDAGLRADNHSKSGLELVPQGGLAFRIGKGELKAMVSKGFRRPTIREMYLFRPANAELEPERIMNYELAWKAPAGDNVTYGLNVFYLKGRNMIQTQMVNGKPLNVNTGPVENSGAELELRWRINSSWSLITNGSFLHMRNPVVAAPELTAYLGLQYHKDKLHISAGGMEVAGLYTAVGDKPVKENFFLANLNASYQLTPWLGIWARGDNLLNQKYEINAGYPMPGINFMAGLTLTL